MKRFNGKEKKNMVSRRDIPCPVNIGIVGGIIGLAAAPWALIAGSVAAFGLGCRLEVVKKDGTTDEVK